MSILARRLLYFRGLKNYTQTGLAEKAGVPQSIVSKIEQGKNIPRADTLQNIAQALGITVNDLLEEQQDIQS